MFAGEGPSYNNNEVAIGPGVNPVACDAITGVCKLGGFTPAQPPADRRRYFLNGVPAFTVSGIYFHGRDWAYRIQRRLAARSIPLITATTPTTNTMLCRSRPKSALATALQFLAHYTFSHAYVYDSNYYSVNKKFSWGPNPYNRNQVFVANTIYELPVGKGKRFMSDSGRAMDLIVGGWQVTNTLTYGTGLPFTPSIGECGTISDAGPCRPNVAPGQSFNVGKRTAACPSGVGNCTFWFTPVAPALLRQPVEPRQCGPRLLHFRAADIRCIRSTRLADRSAMRVTIRCVVRTPSTTTWRSRRAFTITERVKAQFRFDAYNVFNHPVLGFNSTRATLASIAAATLDRSRTSKPTRRRVRRWECVNCSSVCA